MKNVTRNKLIALGIATMASVMINHSVLANTEETVITKQDDVITVDKPEVTMSTQEAYNYDAVNITYQTEIPDEMEINAGDKIVYQLPQEMTWTTHQEFDVYNNENQVVGNARTDVQANNITTTFNDYFHTHPLNKTFGLTMSAQFNRDTTTPGQSYDMTFNGTVIQGTVKKDNGPVADEVVAKWGWQTKEDPNVIQWGGRVNFVKKDLIDVNVSDTWDNNQEYVPNSMHVWYLSSAEPWVPITELDASKVVHRENGFDYHDDRLDGKILHFSYQTRLKARLHATNVMRFTAKDIEGEYRRNVELADATGWADGNARPKPTTFIPGEPPVVEIPEYNPEFALPVDPPVVELPEYNPEFALPVDPPVVELPELNPQFALPVDPPVLEIPEKHLDFGVPGEPPVVEIPELNPEFALPVDPPVVELPELNVPYALPVDPPVHELPELDVPFALPVDPPVLELPELEIPEKPEVPTETPKVEEPNVEVKTETPKRELPQTGTTVSALGLVGLGLMGATLVLKRRKD